MKRLIVIILLAIACNSASAQNVFKYKITGKDEFYYHFPLYNSQSYCYPVTAPKFVDWIGFQLKSKKIKVVSNWQIRTFLYPADKPETQVKILPRENYLKYIGEKINLTFGYQKFVWGMADKINPTDNINPKDYRLTGFDVQKTPVFAFTFDYYPNEKWKLQAVGVPYKQADAIFWNYGDFIPGKFFQKYTFSDIDFNTQQPEIQFIEQDKNIAIQNPDFSTKSTVFGCKINHFSSKIDFAVSYLNDFDNFYTPEITLERYNPGISPQLENKINQTLPAQDAQMLIAYLNSIQSIRIKQMQLHRKRIQRFGFSAKTILGKYGIWTEAAYSQTLKKNKTDYKNRSSDLSFVVGMDFNFGANDQHYFNLQYIEKWIPHFDKDFYSDYKDGLPNTTKQNDWDYMEKYYYRAVTQALGLQNAEYLHAISANIKLSFFDGKFTPSLTALSQIPQNYDTKEKKRYPALLLMPVLDYSPGNRLHFIAGAYWAISPYKKVGETQIKYDDYATILGLAHPYGNVYFKVTYNWMIKN